MTCVCLMPTPKPGFNPRSVGHQSPRIDHNANLPFENCSHGAANISVAVYITRGEPRQSSPRATPLQEISMCSPTQGRENEDY